ncbi:hypothetical protein AAL_07630 [Moelleriella libera RCEF 2490]|uniref:Tse2 ADP-ribosyltransferase toxin domain-containing protein n=1 Tax=Moelleriella libera RCEF 2490 TaxID=1081109 RepID=A0A167X7U7_9HYPO|nr:hypothetical protein AAL_07630 [Moelleriella libera RCEF 2490]
MRPQLTELVMLRALAQAGAENYRVSQRRYLSVEAIHSVIPTSLTYNSPRPRSGLFDHENASRPDDVYDEGVAVEKNGLVYPDIHKHCGGAASNGTVMYPNTFAQQEYVRRYFDDFADREEGGKAVEIPPMFTVLKDTDIVIRTCCG